MTLVRDRSHDDYYFVNTESITGDEPPQPYLDVQRERIALVGGVPRGALYAADAFLDSMEVSPDGFTVGEGRSLEELESILIKD
jgi:hypothetical protein